MRQSIETRRRSLLTARAGERQPSKARAVHGGRRRPGMTCWGGRDTLRFGVGVTQGDRDRAVAVMALHLAHVEWLSGGVGVARAGDPEDRVAWRRLASAIASSASRCACRSPPRLRARLAAVVAEHW